MDQASSAVLSRTVIMFIIVIIGAICYKLKIISDDGKKQLSSLVLSVVNPLLIFLSYQTEFNSMRQFLRNMFSSRKKRQEAKLAEQQAILDGERVTIVISK
jgi:predicted permease